MKVKIKKLHPDTQLPAKGKPGDFCYDVVATSEDEVLPGVWKYGLGFAYEIDREESKVLFFGKQIADDNGYRHEFKPIEYNISIDLRPRSSIYNTGMILSNSEGTLDEFYRGEASAVFYHIKPELPRYKVGDRIGQIKLGITIPMEFEFANEIDMNTERGKGGFGSTGRK